MATHATNRFAGPRTGPVEFNFTGGYLDKSHVKCFIENDTTNVRVDVPITASNFLNDYTLDGLPAVEAGHTLVVYRETPANYLVDFSNTSRITEHSLDVSARQGLFKAVEALDATKDGHNPELSPSVAWGNVIGKPFATEDVPGIVKVGLGLYMGPDGRLNVTGVNAPTGPAGGVLSGTYPNPGFAQDMATQAELNASLGGKADVAHTHPLSAITRSGAGVGQVPVWNGAAWAPGTVGGGGGGGGALPVVVYIGDSLGSDHPNLAASPAVQLERTLNAGGYACRVVNLSVNGHSFFRANTSAVFGTQTVVQQAIALNPAAILVALGFNDTVMAVDGRTLAQVQADATTFFSTLRAALPSAAIVAATELAYDKVNFTPATLKNRGVLPILMTLRTTGILAGCWSSEILEDNVASATSTRFTNFDSLDSTIRGLTTVSDVITLDLWKIARLGLCSHDGLHLTAMGSSLVATTWRKAFKVVTALAALAPNLRALTYGPFDGFMNTDGTIETGGIWDLLMQADGGDDWAIREFSVTGQHTNRQGGPWLHCNPSAWFLPSKGAYRANALEYTTGAVFTWELRGVAPSTAVEASIGGEAFSTIGTTSHRGDYLGSGVLPITPGTYAVRYKVANEVHGPVNLVVTAGTPAATSWQPKVISGAALASTTQTITTANSRTYIDFDGTNYVSSHPDLTLIKSGTETRIMVNVTPGKSVWVRMSVTQLVTASAGTNVLWMIGAEVTNASLGFLYNVQMDAKYSPTTDYALVLTGSFVAKLTATTIFIPWVLRSGTSGTISSSAANGNSSFWSLEIINET